MDDVQIIKPQPGKDGSRGFQEKVLSCDADIAIVGGSAGCGKSWVALLEPLYHVGVSGFYAVFFRRTTVQVRNPGGLWDEARKLYPLAGGIPVEQTLEYRWPETGARVKMAHLEHENTVLDWQGAQVALFIFDELTHFTEAMFWYLLSRNRSMCGVRPYIRATCNPNADSWVANLIAWWIDQETGFPIPERAGVLRYFVRVNDSLIWGDSKKDVAAKCPGVEDIDIKSMTFIPGKLDDNQELLRIDPGYRGRLMAMTRVERARLLDGNWKVRKSAGSYFRRSDVRLLDLEPRDLVVVTRRWDLAASEPTDEYPDPDWTVGVKMGKYPDGRFVVLHAEMVRARANDVRSLIKRVAHNDGHDCSVGIAQDPAQSGKDQADSFVREMAGFNVYTERENGDKETRAEPCAAQWQHQNIDVVRGAWNDAFFSQLEAFPSKDVHDDAIDALCGAFRSCLYSLGSKVSFSASASTGLYKSRR